VDPATGAPWQPLARSSGSRSYIPRGRPPISHYASPKKPASTRSSSSSSISTTSTVASVATTTTSVSSSNTMVERLSVYRDRSNVLSPHRRMPFTASEQNLLRIVQQTRQIVNQLGPHQQREDLLPNLPDLVPRPVPALVATIEQPDQLFMQDEAAALPLDMNNNMVAVGEHTPSTEDDTPAAPNNTPATGDDSPATGANNTAAGVDTPATGFISSIRGRFSAVRAGLASRSNNASARGSGASASPMRGRAFPTSSSPRHERCFQEQVII